MGRPKILREIRICACGCENTFECKISSKKKFLPNHGCKGKNNGMYGKPARNRLPTETRICECDCKGMFECKINSKQRFIHGHNNKKIKIAREIRVCANLDCNKNFEVRITSDHKYCSHKCAMKSIIKSEVRNDKISKKKIGKPTWNKGLTKETDIRIEKYSIGASDRNKKLWQDPIFVAKQMKARNIYPNKAERLLEKILNNLYPGEYKYVGDGQFILAGKCPDFINISGQKKIIELFGDYWHQGEDPQKRINLFTKYGWDTLVIWECELKNIEQLNQKLQEFQNV